MKTILEWLEEAKQHGYDWADAAIRNYDPNFVPIKEANSLIDAIGNAFSWGNSPEKYEYWEGVCESLRAAEETASLEALTKSLRKLNNAIGAYEEQLSEVKPTSLESLIEDLGKLNNALGNLAYNDTLKEPYRTQVYEATKASYEEQLAEVKTEIAKALGLKERKLIGWVVQNEDGGYSKITSPNFIKDNGEWFKFWGAVWSDITTEQVAALCDRLPQWNDEEPTPIYQ